MGLGELADGMVRQVESFGASTHEALFEPVVRVGVTGLARAGKTVFITSLIANLLNRGRMPQLLGAQNGVIRSAYLQPQPDDTVPRFDFENHLAAITGETPHWPESTRHISELRLSFRIQPRGLLGAIGRPRIVHLDIVDYPGEWLLDLALLGKSFAEWSAETLERLQNRTMAQAYLATVGACDGNGVLEEPKAAQLAAGFTDYLQAARNGGYSDCTPGRFLLPGEMAGSPVLTFAPMLRPEKPKRGGLWREMERRFEAYKRRVVKPFFKDHFARIDRQVVLVDALGAIHNGPPAVEDMRHAMADILAAFKPGKNNVLTGVLRGKRVEKILFAATKADHLHHTQHPQLTGIMEALVHEARGRADFAGSATVAMSIASLRATVEETVEHQGRVLDCVRGRLLHGGKTAAFYPGDLPEDPAKVLGPARAGAVEWLGDDYGVMQFAPAIMSTKPGDGPPHIRLDKAAEFLIGDKLR